MEKRTRLPGELLWPLGWCVFMGALALLVAATSELTLVRIIYGALGILYLTVSYSLYRLRNWARIAAGVLFAIGLGLGVLQISLSGFSIGRVGRILMNLWWGVYLFLPSTKRLFVEGQQSRLDPAGCLTQLSLGVFIVGVIVALAAVDSPTWVVIVTLLVSLPVIIYFFETRLDRMFRTLLTRRPPDLDPAAWKVFRTARARRAAGDPDGALQLLETLPDVASVRALKALARVDDAAALDPLEKVVLNAEFVPSEKEQQRLEKAAAVSNDVDRLLEERIGAVEALLEDDARPRSCFGEDAEQALGKLTGLYYFQNALFQHRRDWEKRRELLTGPRARIWLVMRLWERGAVGAAEVAAQACADADVRELARICRMTNDVGTDRVTDDWVGEHTESIILLPFMAEPMRFLLLDLPYMQTFGAPAVASRMRRRIELVARVRRLQREYPEETGGVTAILLCVLSGHPKGVVEKKKAFDAWWRANAERQAGFDAAFAAGLEAAEREDWTKAAASFKEAQEAWPDRASAAYNRALACHRSGNHAEAETIFEKLTRDEPEEALFWMRLGDVRRAQGKRAEALENYRKVARLGDLGEEVAVRLGVLLAQEGREEEAVEALKPATGKDVPAEMIDSLADFLESQGVYRLAHRYRQEAMERELQRAKETAEEEDGEEGEGDVDTMDPSGEAEEFPEEFVRGMKALKMRLFRDACGEFERMVERQPDNGAAWHFLGLARLGASRKEEARDAFRKSAEANESPYVGRVECPECGWIPAGEALWGCDKCGATFDTFRTRAKCPRCAQSWRTTACLACNQTPAHETWWREGGA